jgi:hypothetical protein
MSEEHEEQVAVMPVPITGDVFYHIRFREDGQQFTASSTVAGLKRDTVVMVKTDHGLEPAWIKDVAPPCMCSEKTANGLF